jgi:hypothetical protein
VGGSVQSGIPEAMKKASELRKKPEIGLNQRF